MSLVFMAHERKQKSGDEDNVLTDTILHQILLHLCKVIELNRNSSTSIAIIESCIRHCSLTSIMWVSQWYSAQVLDVPHICSFSLRRKALSGNEGLFVWVAISYKIITCWTTAENQQFSRVLLVFGEKHFITVTSLQIVKGKQSDRISVENNVYSLKKQGAQST